MYKIDAIDPPIYIWSGEFINDDGHSWQHRAMALDHNFELIIATSGTISLIANGTQYSLYEGECLLLPPFTQITGDTPSTVAFTIDWLHFLAKGQPASETDPEYLKGLQDITAHVTPTSINHLIYLPTKFMLHNKHYIFQLFRQLLTMSTVKSYSGRKNDFMTSLLLTELSNDFLNTQSLLHAKNPSNVEYIAEWVRVHLADNPTVASIADQFELNPTYLSRKFRNEYGIGIKSYILEQKIIYARYLLSTTILPINDVAEQSFFESPKHFMRSFKQHVGVTPTTYRHLYSNTHMNSTSVDPISPIPSELGTPALRRLLNDIFSNHETLT
ncbi:AraC family transcriptional regulator [Sporolactobacillus shoreicorticis]|uniref:Helix-turn-helix transcriptional regulator n=1 Tax=Sporolactobacillus shoreicorticis TaxID=1923877 RepID=A0ABW5S0X5_9BACL|nr:AraC family transcriptional regulator [Sporolactobacillus shoreicorticis]MCO7124690.1 AraC family transcriptional regulator [Sporolactobacillus shoreicorticis]